MGRSEQINGALWTEASPRWPQEVFWRIEMSPRADVMCQPASPPGLGGVAYLSGLLIGHACEPAEPRQEAARRV